jgi:hypothetical protein
VAGGARLDVLEGKAEATEPLTQVGPEPGAAPAARRRIDDAEGRGCDA